MQTSNPLPVIGRRQLLGRVLPACTFSCLACPAALARQQQSTPPAKHKFQEDSAMSYQAVWNFAFQEGLIPILKALSAELGKDRFDATLRKVCSDIGARRTAEFAKKQARRDLSDFLTPLRKPSRMWSHVLTFQIVEDTEKAAEVKITECLWARTFRDAGAADIGYSAICYPDYASAPAFNPKMKMIRTKTLMQGHDCCNHRWVLEA